MEFIDKTVTFFQADFFNERFEFQLKISTKLFNENQIYRDFKENMNKNPTVKLLPNE